MAFVCAQLLLALAWVAPGPLSIDEAIYHRMTHSLVEGHGLSLWNGFEERPSAELTALLIRPSEGRLVAPYPYGLPVLAAPLYALMGLRGLFVLNALAFVGVLLVTQRLASQLLDSTAAGLGAASILALGTYAWEYSMAAWPHCVAVFFGLAALAATWQAAREPSGARSGLRLSLLAGLALGIGTTVRLDVFFLLPLVLLPFVAATSIRWRELLSIGCGLAPGLLFASATNLARWGTSNPFTYGWSGKTTDAETYLPFLFVGLGSFLALRISVALSIRRFLNPRPGAFLLAGTAVLSLLLLIPAVRELALRVAHGAYTIVVDLRNLPMDRLEPAMERTGNGAVVYYGAVKKALLQSCPYLPVLLIPLLDVRRRSDAWRPQLFLLAPLVLLTGIFSFHSWHGGLALNMRYLLPALPFVSILALSGLRSLARDAYAAWLPLSGAAALSAIVAYFLLRPPDHALRPMESLLLEVPLAIAAVVGVSCIAWRLRPRPALATLALVAAGTGLGWTSVVAFAYDASWAYHRRAAHHSFALETARHIPPDSLLLAEAADPFYGIIEHRSRVRVALPWIDQFRDTRKLIEHQHQQGRPVFGALSTEAWRGLARAGVLRGFHLEAITRVGPFHLARLALDRQANRRGSPR